MKPVLGDVRVGIKRLRQLGGDWTAHRNGLGRWYYTGTLHGHTYEIRAYAHFAPRYEGDDDNYEVLWHTTRDGVPWGYATRYPVELVECGHEAPIVAREAR